jgi:DNA-binding XRE family transcriptional regulator
MKRRINMSFGKNLQYLRQLSKNMTQEALAEKLNVSRQTISKWEMDAANPEMDKALEICKIFNCSLDNLFREEMDKRSDAYSNLRVEEVARFRYIEHTVISTEPESDAISRMYKIAKDNGIDKPKVIGWDFPNLSQEQVNVFNMHGYTAALILPDGLKIDGVDIKEQPAHKYVAIHIDRPFDNPFVTIPGAYHTLNDFMRTNGFEQVNDEVIPCFETDGEGMDVYLACK